MASNGVVGRFAPSPSGRMHAGNVYAALMCWLMVKSRGGRIVLRIEDLDVQRSKPEHADRIMRDFQALGLYWDEGPYYQSARNDAYEEAYTELCRSSRVYPCFCTRADLHVASAPHRGEKLVYPGTCRHLSVGEAAARERETGRRPAFRLEVPNRRIEVDDLIQGPFVQNLATECGDFVIKRSDGLFAYQLAVVVDDADQGVNFVVRGMDLLVSTPQQVLLQDLLGHGRCEYAHVPLIVGERDRRLSKRDRDAGLDELLDRFGSPAGVIGHIAWIAGLADRDEPATPEELLDGFQVPNFPDKVQIPWR